METGVRKGGETQKSMLSRDRLNTDRLSASSPPTPHIQLPECPCPKCPTHCSGLPRSECEWVGCESSRKQHPRGPCSDSGFPWVSGSVLPESLALPSGTTCPPLLTSFKVTAPEQIDSYCLDRIGYRNISSVSACLKMPSCSHMCTHPHMKAPLTSIHTHTHTHTHTGPIEWPSWPWPPSHCWLDQGCITDPSAPISSSSKFRTETQRYQSLHWELRLLMKERLG